MIAGVFYTLEDFLTHADGVIYLILGGFLLLFLWFWSFLVEREKKG